MDKNKRTPGLTIKEVIFVLALSWFYTLLTYYTPISISNNTRSICEIYTIEAIPFTLCLGAVLYWLNK